MPSLSDQQCDDQQCTGSFWYYFSIYLLQLFGSILLWIFQLIFFYGLICVLGSLSDNSSRKQRIREQQERDRRERNNRTMPIVARPAAAAAAAAVPAVPAKVKQRRFGGSTEDDDDISPTTE
eukprot:CAMPEP_0182516322 /NCGR_PEP_ID=MMETSP1321-20130603/40049_1 /TAXON_ID=91990 /ORGANISM="Bolidomonas sp., Strain RCC1657" /LENGTH=121 /DNA_ID=CAMNT_0024723879 /DNA_START=102 /DNA_END=467 /DNA_ORIENTATION=-